MLSVNEDSDERYNVIHIIDHTADFKHQLAYANMYT